MDITRRAFLRHLGITLGGLVLAGCSQKLELSDGRVLLPAHGRIRQLWRDLGELEARTRQSKDLGRDLMQQLIADHRAALDEITSAGMIDASVANDVHIAYVSAARHMWSTTNESSIIVTCYVSLEPPRVVKWLRPSPTSTPTIYPNSRLDELQDQARLVATMAQEGRLSHRAVARARAAIERDIAGLVAPGQKDIPPDAAAAARFLVELLGPSR